MSCRQELADHSVSRIVGAKIDQMVFRMDADRLGCTARQWTQPPAARKGPRLDLGEAEQIISAEKGF